ncbi:MAG TPA: Na/Pi cotransporter family protein [Chloroflexota bacterium]
MSGNIALISIAGAVGLLLFGMHVISEALQRVAGQRLRHLLSSLGRNRLAGVATGIVITAALQSSNATTLMVVGFARAGLMSLRESIGLILGADIGTTLTVQLLAFRIYDYALLLVAIGAALFLSSRRQGPRDVGQAILGFGLVFFALRVIIETMSPVRDNQLIRELFASLGDAPLLAILVAAVFAAVTTSSAATIGIVLVLAADGILPIKAAVPLVLGANIGTSIPAFLSGVGANPEARRVALVNVLFKGAGVLLFLPFTGQVADLMALTAPDPARQVANTHTLFNVIITLAFLPFTDQLARLVEGLIPAQAVETGFRPRYLDEYVLESPPLALGEATREVLRMADIVQEMVRDTLAVLQQNDEPLLDQLEEREDTVDFLEEAIKSYLTRLSQQSLTEEQSKREVGLLYLIGELEHIGDIVDKSLASLARQKIGQNFTFSVAGMGEVEDFHRRVLENLRTVITAVATRDQELARKVLSEKSGINRMERELRQAHIQRLHAGTRESMETSSIHIDVLNDLKRINSHATNMAYVVLGEL